MKASDDKNHDGKMDGKGSFGARMAKYRKGGRKGKRGKGRKASR
jgi:hypothetical protein